VGKKDERNIVYLAICIKKGSRPKLPQLVSAALPLARLRWVNFWLRLFLQFVNSQIVSFFFATICKFARCFWLGFFFDMYKQIFSSVLDFLGEIE
jgi:hypothetical protein